MRSLDLTTAPTQRDSVRHRLARLDRKLTCQQQAATEPSQPSGPWADLAPLF
jgi:hypothetical protein